MNTKRGTIVPPSREIWLSWLCVCDKKCGAYVEHYDVIRCGHCGAFYWALKPLRHGPLQMFPWPGLYARSAQDRRMAA